MTRVIETNIEPWLTTASLYCPLAEGVLSDGQKYWYPWAEPIGPVSDPAAAKIGRVLRAIPEPSRG